MYKLVATSSLLLLLLFIVGVPGARIYVHMMPWFETKESSGTGQWGIHWTMANRNPDNIVDGHQDIASYYHPVIGAYASSDPSVIDWQMGVMKTAGIAGVLIDWPGTTNFADYPKNKQNAEAIIEGAIRAGLEFAIVYEDNNLDLAGVGDKIGQGTQDMTYLRDNYFTKPNYVNLNGAPLLLDFGPQALTDGSQWEQIFNPLNPKPTFLTLWYKQQLAGASARGEYCWIYSDFMDGLNNFYRNHDLEVKIGCAYPGFNTFYEAGGWPGPGFNIPYGPDTFRQTLDLALSSVDFIQIATWNDYGEGTIIEPTDEYQYQFVEILQEKTGVKYTKQDFEKVTEIYHLRKMHQNNATMLKSLEAEFLELVHRYD